MEFNHKPVMLSEVIEGLNIKKDGIYVENPQELNKILEDYED